MSKAGRGKYFAADMADLAKDSKGKSIGINIDEWESGSIDEFLNKQIGNRKYDNLVLCAHAGDDIANEALRTLFNPKTSAGATFLTAFKPFIADKPLVFLYMCKGGPPPDVVQSLANHFHGDVYNQGLAINMGNRGPWIFPMMPHPTAPGKVTNGPWAITHPTTSNP